MTQYRWFIIAFAFIGIIITYLDRTALSYAIGPIEKAFGLTNADFGIVSAAFGLGYMIMAICGGIIVDHFGARRVWSLFAIFWSLVCASFGLAMGITWLITFRILLGLTEGPSFPSFTRSTADWLPVSERARSIALGLAAVPFASVIGAPFISHLIAFFGWRVMFFVLGSFGIVWAICWFIIFRDHPEESKHVSADELIHIRAGLQVLRVEGVLIEKKTTWRFMLLNPSLIANNYAFFVFGYLLYFSINWLPGYIAQTYHVEIVKVGWFLVVPWLTATILVLFGGFLSDWLWFKTQSIRFSRSYIIWIGQVLSALCFLPVVLTHSLLIDFIFIPLGLGFGFMPNAAFYAINADLARDRAATSLGIMISASSFSGILAPLLTGWLSTLTGNFVAAISLMIGLTFSSALVVILFQHPDEVIVN